MNWSTVASRKAEIKEVESFASSVTVLAKNFLGAISEKNGKRIHSLKTSYKKTVVTDLVLRPISAVFYCERDSLAWCKATNEDFYEVLTLLVLVCNY